ncbi:hypothetical protein [Limosilactobacillus reuteri]|nr:hypothetical protein [Limosilactobacillus reuteri]
MNILSRKQRILFEKNGVIKQRKDYYCALNDAIKSPASDSTP